ncbi:MAG: c-di-GMP-binding flagellar brake protein YcgR [Bacteriovoracaceae bacterium]|jgi:c-di-GMP-binding flagellar brake protein YcgR
MKCFKKEVDREQMSEVIQGMFLDFNPIVTWEVSAENIRTIYPVKIQNVNNDDDTLTFVSSKEENLAFSQSTIFFYSEEQKAIFKSSIDSQAGSQLIVKIPKEIKKLEVGEEEQFVGMLDSFSSDSGFTGASGLDNFSLDDDEDENPQGENTSINDNSSITADNFDTKMSFSGSTDKIETMWVTKTMSAHDADLFATELSYIALEEEDKIFEGVRAAPRAKPPEGKMLTVQIEDNSRPQSTHTLYDLSQGGLSFLVFSRDEFNEGERLLVRAFDTKKFDKPMLTEVKAIREADDLGIQYKVGCQFIEYEEADEAVVPDE